MLHLIETAISQNANRQQAEKSLLLVREQNTQAFFREAAEIFSNKNTTVGTRTATGTLMAVSIVAKNPKGQFFWQTLDTNLRTEIKQKILEVLIYPDRNQRRTAANIVSAICFIQLPRNEWNGIVEKICENVNYNDQNIKQASITTLGFICNRMKQKVGFSFNPELQQNILSGIILGLQQNEKYIIQNALKALRDSISSLSNVLSQQNVRTFVLSKILDICKNQNYSRDGLEILGQFVQVCYQFLAPYIQGLIKELQQIINNVNNVEECIAALQVFQNIAAQYKQLSDRNSPVGNILSGNNGQYVVTMLLNKLSIMGDGDEQTDNEISDSASKALETIFTNGSLQYKSLVLNFVSISIQQADWKHRQASIKAFSLLLYGLPQQQISNLISSSINQLVGLLDDQSRQVQFATLDSFVIITQLSGKYFMESQKFYEYLSTILTKVSVSKKFLQTVCRIIDNLCDQEKEVGLGKIDVISKNLIDLLFKYVSADATTEIINWVTCTIMSIVDVTSNQEVLKDFLIFILQNFDGIKQVPNKELRQILSNSFLTIIQYCLHRLRDYKLPQEVLVQIYNKIVNHFIELKDVDADGFYAMGALVRFFEGNIDLLNSFWGYFQHSLKSFADQTLFKATTDCLISFLNVYGDSFEEKLHTIIPLLISNIENPNFPKQLKPQCLLVLGEIFLVCGKVVQPFLKRSLQIIMVCCSAAIHFVQIDFGYSEILKQMIIETLMCINHSPMFNKSLKDEFCSYIDKIIQFMVLTCNKATKPKIEYINKCVVFISDLTKSYPSVIRPLKIESFMIESIKTLKQYNKRDAYTKSIKYAEQFFR